MSHSSRMFRHEYDNKTRDNNYRDFLQVQRFV